MERHLVVTQTFGDYAVGDRITKAETIASVLESHPHAVVAVEPVEEAEPELALEAPAKPVADAATAPDKVKK